MLNLDIKPGETVVVTGCNGFIGSSVANEFLLRGYTVRGTVRSATRCAWLLDHFAARHGRGRFSLVEIPDLTDAASYGPALASASALLVTTSAADFTQTDPDAHIPLAVAQTLAPLAAAATSPTIKSVVLTGSGWAVSEPQACPPSSDDAAAPPLTLDQFTWNDAAVAAAHAPSYADAAARGRAVFVASMVEKERAAWAWVRARAPRWRFNVVLVATVFGAIPCAARQGTPSSARFPAALLAGGEEAAAAARRRVRPQWFVDAEDAARVHVAVAVKADVAGERVFAFAGRFGSNDVLRVLRGLFPERELVGDDEREGECRTRVMNQRGEGLLKEMGREGWTGLEVSVKRLVESARPVLAV